MNENHIRKNLGSAIRKVELIAAIMTFISYGIIAYIIYLSDIKLSWWPRVGSSIFLIGCLLYMWEKIIYRRLGLNEMIEEPKSKPLEPLDFKNLGFVDWILFIFSVLFLLFFLYGVFFIAIPDIIRRISEALGSS